MTSTTSVDEVMRASGCAFVAGALKDMLFYGLDSYKVMKQAGQSVHPASLFRGIVPIAVSGSGIAFGVYFVFYYPIRNACTKVLGPGSDTSSVFIASAISAVPSSLVGVPADVMKKRLVLQSTSGGTMALRQTAAAIYSSSGLSGFFLGWKVNVLRDVPYAGLKMSLYEGLARYYVRYKHRSSDTGDRLVPLSANADKLTGTEAGAMGFLSGILTAIMTCPIDCVNTRIKSGELAHLNMLSAHREVVRKDGVHALFRGLVPRCAIIGFGSTVFWYIQASLLSQLAT